MNMTAASGIVVLVAAIAGVTDPKAARVSGAVTLDGVPVADGTIEFLSAGPGGTAAGGGIANGAYSVRALPGEVTVSIRAPEVVGKRKLYDTPDSPTVDVHRETVPDRYNARSTLRVTLKPGVNVVNFDLKGK